MGLWVWSGKKGKEKEKIDCSSNNLLKLSKIHRIKRTLIVWGKLSKISFVYFYRTRKTHFLTVFIQKDFFQWVCWSSFHSVSFSYLFPTNYQLYTLRNGKYFINPINSIPPLTIPNPNIVNWYRVFTMRHFEQFLLFSFSFLSLG